jgi:hypothetical protein
MTRKRDSGKCYTRKEIPKEIPVIFQQLSRATSGDRVSVLLPETTYGRDGHCLNVVYNEVFEG